MDTDTAGEPLWANSVLNPANWTITRNGGVITGGVISVTPLFGNTYVVAFDRDPTTSAADPLGTPGAADTYVLTASASIQSIFGNALDGNLDGLPGGNFNRSFSIDLLPAPTVTGISPSAGPLAGGTTVTITGTNLNNAAAVSFGATMATIVSDTASQLVVTSPAGTVGTVDVTVVTASGSSATSAADQFTYVATPTVTAISPASGPAAGGTTVTITGTGLANATAVKFGATLATIVSDTATQIVVTSPANVAGNVAGTVDVTVVTVGGTSANSSADLFIYVPAPTVTGISPSVGPATGGTTVTITGTGLANASAVKFGTKTATTIISDSDTLLVVNSPANVAGTVDVTVATLGGTSATLAADQFTYTPVPAVTSLSPPAGPLVGGTTVTITGTNLANATAVTFGSKAAAIVSNTATQIVVTNPAGLAGTVDVTVVTTGGISTTSSADQFTYVPVPAVTSLSPSTGPVTGGRTVTITGTGLANATAVKFGAAIAAIVSDTATQIVVTNPVGVVGTVDVTVVTAGGTSATSAADLFTYVPAPTVSRISPAAGPVAGGTTVTITGTGLTNATAVKFGTKTATIVSDTATQIVVTSPPAVAGTVDVTITTANGTSATSAADQFTYAPVPAVTSLSPSSGLAAGGTSVVITGTGLANATAVKFGSTAATTIVSDTATQIVVASPPGVAGTVDVTVVTAGGTSAPSAADRFTYLPSNLVVTTAVDEIETTYNAADLSLRTALALANALPGAQTVSFDPSLNGKTIALSLGELAITDSVTIAGPGTAKLTINAGGQSRIFDVDDSNASNNINVEIDGLTLTGGNANDGGAIDSGRTSPLII